MNWRGCGRKQPWPSLRDLYLPGIGMEGVRNITESISFFNQSLG